MSNSDHSPAALPPHDLPPLPPIGATGPQVCETVRLYLAIMADLTPEQVAIVREHVRICEACAKVQSILLRATSLFANLPTTTPSDRVDAAVMAALAARGSLHSPAQGIESPPILREGRQYRQRRPLAFSLAVVAVAALLLLVLRIALPSIGGSGPARTQSFSLPANLSWSSDVLYHSETRIDARGEHYQIDTYHNLKTGEMHVETVMDGSLDVVEVSDPQKTLGLDMMHHVAEWNVQGWSVDETPFNLPELRSDLATSTASYLDTDMFHGQPVYRIRCRDGLVLLLDMSYTPVNVLRGAIGQGTGEPIYDTLKLMPQIMVSSSMWSMSIPGGFSMGTLPQRPV